MSAERPAFTPYGYMLAACFFFAWMSEIAHWLGPTCDWRLIALLRSFLALIFASLLAQLAGAQLVFWHTPMLWLRSCAGSLSLLCTFFALTQLRAAEVLTLTNTFPIWVALLSWPLLHVRPRLSVWLAAGCGILGIVLIQQPHFQVSDGARLAIPLALVAALTSALAMLGLHRLKGLHPWAIVVHFSAVATVTTLTLCFLGEPVPVEHLLDSHHLLLFLGLGATATLGQLCLTQAFTAGSPARVSVVGLTQVLFALGIDQFLGGCTFDLTTLAGISLVIAPTAWMMLDRANQ